MTTLELAAVIVKAVRLGPQLREADAAVVVLDVLRAHDSWFCRVSEDAAGCTVETGYLLVQPSLFDD